MAKEMEVIKLKAQRRPELGSSAVHRLPRRLAAGGGL